LYGDSFDTDWSICITKNFQIFGVKGSHTTFFDLTVMKELFPKIFSKFFFFGMGDDEVTNLDTEVMNFSWD
jgi:hypothetical protein